MIVRRVRLRPFAGIGDREVELESGLNVVLGRNEAGKSTLLRAVRYALFESTQLTPKQFESTVGSLLPATGGDVVRVDAEVEVGDGDVKPESQTPNGGTGAARSPGGTTDTGRSAPAADSILRIEKVWKRGNRAGSTRVFLPNGSEIEAATAAEASILSRLPCSQATFESVLLSEQGAVYTALDNGPASETSEELGRILRSAVMETGGVSMERFFSRLDERLKEYFAKWDRALEYPEGGRGPANPLTRGTGEVVKAFYRKEEVRRQLDSAREHETRISEAEQRLTEVERTLRETDAEYSQKASLLDAARERARLESEIGRIDAKLETLSELMRKWPIAEHELEGLPASIEATGEEAEELRRRVETAQVAERQRRRLDRARRVAAIGEKVTAAESELAGNRAVDEETIRELREKESERAQLSARIEAAVLSVSLRFSEKGSVQVTRADGSQETVSADAGERRTIRADAKLRLEHDGLQISVVAGEGELDEAISRRNECAERVAALLEAIGVESVAEAEARYERYRERSQALDYHRAELEAELAGERYEDVVSVLHEALPEESHEDVEVLREQLTTARGRLGDLERRREELSRSIEEWTRKYGTFEEMSTTAGDLRSERTKLAGKLEQLPKLPAGVSDAESFVREVNAIAARREELREELGQLKIRVAEIEATAPEESAEELAGRYESACEVFEQTKARGEAIARVHDRARSLRQELEGDVWGPLQQRFRAWVATTTGERFESVEMDEARTRAFATAGGVRLAPRQLSWGTRDSIALALRLTLAEYTIGGAGGFVIFDDPLVDMDPPRRSAACEAIARFADHHQTIVLTCHPQHAGELGGHTIRMDE